MSEYSEYNEGANLMRNMEITKNKKSEHHNTNDALDTLDNWDKLIRNTSFMRRLRVPSGVLH